MGKGGTGSLPVCEDAGKLSGLLLAICLDCHWFIPAATHRKYP